MTRAAPEAPICQIHGSLGRCKKCESHELLGKNFPSRTRGQTRPPCCEERSASASDFRPVGFREALGAFFGTFGTFFGAFVDPPDPLSLSLRSPRLLGLVVEPHEEGEEQRGLREVLQLQQPPNAAALETCTPPLGVEREIAGKPLHVAPKTVTVDREITQVKRPDPERQISD